MTTLYIAEIASLGIDAHGVAVLAPSMPPAAEQTVAIGGSSAASAAFGGTTRFVRIHTDSICSIAFGAAPTATHDQRPDERQRHAIFQRDAGSKGRRHHQHLITFFNDHILTGTPDDDGNQDHRQRADLTESIMRYIQAATLALGLALAMPALAQVTVQDASVTVGTTATPCVPAGTKTTLLFYNGSANTITYCYGANCAPSSGTAGSYDIASKNWASWGPGAAPKNAMTCIAGSPSILSIGIGQQ